jgi:hypothetical protein
MKTILLTTAACALLFLSACSGDSASTTNQPEAAGSTQPQQQPNAIVSIHDAILNNSSVKCTLPDVDDQGEGIIYLKGKKMRLEQDTNIEEVGFSYMINDGEWMYTWSEKGEGGIKFDLSKLQEMTEDVQNKTVNEYDDVEEWADSADRNISCEAFNVPDDMFAAPTSITFQDMTEMVNQMQEWSQNAEANPESVDVQSLEELGKMFGAEVPAETEE